MFDVIDARPAAQRAEATRYTFNAEMDDEARRVLFPFTGRVPA